MIRKIKRYSTDYYCTDKWKMYKSLPRKQNQVGKKHTTQIESLNANVRHYLARFRRKTRCYSKSVIMVELSLFLLFFNYVLNYLF